MFENLNSNLEIQSNSKVSVCMITYGHEKYIREAIEGVLMQECDFEVELILSNDCSPDNTDAIVKDIIQNHPRGSWIKYFNHHENLGMMQNFIFALDHCQGDYIALCDGDDYWIDFKKLAKQYYILESDPSYRFCVTNVDFLNEKTKNRDICVLNTLKKPIYTDFKDFMLNRGFMAPSTWFGKRECFFFTDYSTIDSDATFGIFMDVLWNCKYYFLNDSSTVYRILEESGSRSKSLLHMYRYYHGIYKIQLQYIEKYEILNFEETITNNQLKIMIDLFKSYPRSPEMIETMRLFQIDYDSKGLMKIVEDSINSYIKKIEQLDSSKSMALGRLIIRPVMFLKQILLKI